MGAPNTETASEKCTGATGRESDEHNFIHVTKSSYSKAPYDMCSKCGQRRETASADAGEGVERTMSGETVHGFKVEAWRYHAHGDNPEHGHRYCEHWSTPGRGAWAVERMFTEEQLRAALRQTSSEPVAWIVGNGSDTRWRAWDQGNPVWVDDRQKATRYSRREDAEAVHAEDEDAWTVKPFTATAPAAPEHAASERVRAEKELKL